MLALAILSVGATLLFADADATRMRRADALSRKPGHRVRPGDRVDARAAARRLALPNAFNWTCEAVYPSVADVHLHPGRLLFDWRWPCSFVVASSCSRTALSVAPADSLLAIFRTSPPRELSRIARLPLARAGAPVTWFPLIQLAVIVAVDRLRLEVALPSTSTIYFSSGTAEPVVSVESTLLLPLLFTTVAALFVTLAQRMGRELTGRPPLRAYVINLLGSLAGVAAFALVPGCQPRRYVWFVVSAAAALRSSSNVGEWRGGNIALLAASHCDRL